MVISFFPLFHMDDLTRDGNVDLQDVIVVIKGVARTVETSESIKQSVGRVVSVINVAAGLKTVLKPSKSKGLSKNTSLYDYFLTTSNLFVYFSNDYFFTIESNIQYKSLVFPPIPPPPKQVSEFV